MSDVWIDPTEEDADRVRVAFVRLAVQAGRRFTGRRLAPERGVHGDCWDHAWDASRTHGAYVEGVCTVDGGLHAAHAWTIDAFGIIEHTKGYETATDYRGFIIDRARAEVATGDWAMPRSSVLEVAIAGGVSVGNLIDGEAMQRA